MSYRGESPDLTRKKIKRHRKDDIDEYTKEKYANRQKRVHYKTTSDRNKNDLDSKSDYLKKIIGDGNNKQSVHKTKNKTNNSSSNNFIALIIFIIFIANTLLALLRSLLS